MRLTLMENPPRDAWSGQACDSEGGQAELPLHREEARWGVTMPTRSASGVQARTQYSPTRRRMLRPVAGSPPPLPGGQLKGGQPSAGQFQNSRHLEMGQLQVQTGASALHPHLRNQSLTQPVRSAAHKTWHAGGCRDLKGENECFLASTSNGSPSQDFQVRPFFSSADLPVSGSRRPAGAGNAFVHVFAQQVFTKHLLGAGPG